MLRAAFVVAIVASVLAGTVAAASCEDEVRLDAAAAVRLAQLEACDCLSHAGFDEAIIGFGGWHGEVVADDPAPLTLESATAQWEASPTHKAILDHTRTAEGFATSDKPTASGMYYAVLIVEDNP